MGNVKAFVIAAAAALTLSVAAQAQDAKTEPLVNPNTAGEKEIASVPQITPEMAKATVAKRPFKTVVELDAFLKTQKLTADQLKEVYGRMFIPIDLNTASDAEILLIPGVGKRMLHEFKEYRPYKAIEQFRREIGKYVDKTEVARLERYVTIK
jgi:DNA uptake protein ComE-like DNA-binding protein